MRRAIALVLLGVASCTVERTNPYDPDGTVRPYVDVLQPYAITCRSWETQGGGIHPFPPGFDPAALSAEEADDITNRCAGPCAAGEGNCEQFLVLTSQARSPAARCTETENSIELRYLEILYQQDAEKSVDLVLPGATRELIAAGLEDDGLAVIQETADAIAFHDAYTAVHYEGSAVTSAAIERFRDDILLTRPLLGVNRAGMTLTFKGGFGSNVTTCRVDVQFDQATEVIEHPAGWGGGYGRHVAMANLTLGDGAIVQGVSNLEMATTYALGEGSCWVDVVYRDAAGRLAHAETDATNIDLEAMCDGNGQPPPIGAGRFFTSGDEGFVVPLLYGGDYYLDFIGRMPGDDPYAIGAAEYFVFEDFAGAPLDLAGVGNIFGGATDDIALLSPGGETMSVCTPTGTCTQLAPPDCAGGAARYVDIAEWPGEVELTELLVATQSTSSTCVLWYDPGPPFSIAREATFAKTAPVQVHWATRQGVPSAMLNGYVSLDDTVAAVEMPALPAAPTEYPLYFFDDGITCEPTTGADGAGIGVSGASELIKECAVDGSGCSVTSYRALGLPNLDVIDYTGLTVPDHGALAYYSYGCADPDDAYYAVLPPYLGEAVRPTRIGSAMATRLDVPRSRQPNGSICEIPSTMVLGAPGDGPLGGAGSMIVIYPSGGTERTQPFCEPVLP